MRRATLVALAAAVVLALGAALTGRAWLEAQAKKAAGPGNETIVVAARALTFGDKIGPADVREVRWPAESVPQHAFRSIAAMQLEKEPRSALYAHTPNEPILATRVTGPEQRAVLSAIVTPGMRAFAIRVNDVVGVGGFVAPDDRVDVILVRAENGAYAVNQQFRSDLLMQNVRVLGIDQEADATDNQPKVARAVTLEVTAEQTQILSLATQAGTITLALRNQGASTLDMTRTVTLSDLKAQSGFQNIALTSDSEPRPKARAKQRRRAAARPAPKSDAGSITVVRGADRQETVRVVNEQ
jgi:pilus assembly protein CpaB